MILLALDASASLESAALLNQDRLLAARQWPGDRAHGRQLFDAVRSLLDETGLAPDQIAAYAVGLGPGSFTGLRMALAGACGMALPGGAPVHGLPSAAAAAAEAAAETGAARLLVCGDARRDRIWSACFTLQDGLPEQDGAWQIDPAETLAERLASADAVCTADWPALADPLRRACAGRAGVALLARPVIPAAATVGRLARLRMLRGLPSLPLVPLYLHPAVFVPPSFPAAKAAPQESP